MHIGTDKIGKFGLFLLICLLGSGHVVQARIYKWVDKDGVVQYTQTPPPAGVSAKEIKPPPPPPDAAAAAKKLQQQQAEFNQARQENIKEEKEQQKDEQLAAEKKQKCEQARVRLNSLQRPRVNVVGKDGERRRMTEEEREAGLAKAREMVDKLCK